MCPVKKRHVFDCKEGKMSVFLNSRYRSLCPYVPGEQPKDRKYLKLNTNESPFPPGPEVQTALSCAAAADLRLYEDPDNAVLKAALAQHFKELGLSADCFCPTAGSDEALDLCFMAFAEDSIQFPDVSYGFYAVLSELHRLDARVTPVREDFRIDPSDYQRNDRCIVLANPNAPTGLALGETEIRALLSRNPDHVVIIDEAYVDFGGQSALPLIREYENLVVCRTFSKSRSLAGARIGFAAGSPPLIQDLERLRNSRNPYNISTLSQLIGEAALREPEYYTENCRKIIGIREWTLRELRKLGFTAADSLGNFVFARSGQLGGRALALALRERGILVRHFPAERTRDYNRITIGTQAEMERLVETLAQLLEDC